MRVLLASVVVATSTLTIATTEAQAIVPAGERLCPQVVAGAPGDIAVVNLTPVGAVGPGNGQLVSSEVASPPLTSNVNFDRNTVDPNVAVAPIGADGRVCFVNSPNAGVDVIVDQLLSFRSASFRSTTTGAPVRIADTRVALSGPTLRPDERRCMATGAPQGELVLVNLLPLNATAPGNGVLVPEGTAGRPTASNVNFAPGSVDPNLAVAVSGPGGEVCFANSEHASVDLVADVLGSVRAGAFAPTSTGGPVRLFDTRVGLGGSRLRASEIRCVATDLQPRDIAIVNLLPLSAAARGFGALGTNEISHVNVTPGGVDPNVAFAPVDEQGRLCYVNSDHGAVDLVADLLASVPATEAVASTETFTAPPQRLIDSRPAPDTKLACPTAQRCYRVDGDNAVSVSNSGGRTWADVSVGFARQLTSVACTTVDRCWATDTFFSRDFQSYITLDGGRTWSTPSFELSPSDLECPTQGICLVVGLASGASFMSSRAAAITRDGGATWSWIRLPMEPTDPFGSRLDGLSCGATSCLVQAARISAQTLTILTLSTTDGWQTVSVTEQ